MCSKLTILALKQKQPTEVLYEKSCFENFAIITGKHLCCSLLSTNFIKKRFQQICFPVNIAKFLKTPTSKNNCEWLLWTCSA